jgi:hypothetical protein
MTNDTKFKITALTKIREDWGDEPGQFLVQLHCELSEEGDLGGEAFQVTVTSPSHLSRDLSKADGVELGRGYLFMLDYDEKQISSRLQDLVNASAATTWHALESFITKYFDWID